VSDPQRDPQGHDKARERQIAENESVRQTTGAFRVSTFAILIAALIALALFGWLWLAR
jgi:cobalamin biosynthesis Mg chelatase CobN